MLPADQRQGEQRRQEQQPDDGRRQPIAHGRQPGRVAAGHLVQRVDERVGDGSAGIDGFANASERLALSPQCGFATSVLGNALTVEDERAKLRTIGETARAIWG